LVTQGDNESHALAKTADAMDEVFAAYMLGGLALPAPSWLRKEERWVLQPTETMRLLRTAPPLAFGVDFLFWVVLFGFGHRQVKGNRVHQRASGSSFGPNAPKLLILPVGTDGALITACITVLHSQIS